MSHPHKDSPPPTADKGRHWSNKDRALVSSWIENEGQCVTLARLALHLSLPRTQASFLLQQQLAEAATKANSNKGVGEAVDHQQNDYDDKSSKRYHATWCEVEAKTWTAREDNGRMEEEEVVPCTGKFSFVELELKKNESSCCVRANCQQRPHSCYDAVHFGISRRLQIKKSFDLFQKSNVVSRRVRVRVL
jgi:hypothetical protein